jgi:hypothetical protein
VTFITSASDRACLSNWGQPLAVSDILNLLLDLRRALAVAGSPVILILVIRQAVPLPAAFLLNSLQASVPAILDSCAQLVIVIEGAGIDRAPLRSVFQTTRRTVAKQTPPQIFDSLSAAFAHAQRFAPHDVLELQRLVLRQSFPPHGHRT